jgi:poly(hydroxyalkanoate) depolymerase family esterase
MNAASPAEMAEVTRLTRAGRLPEATALLQRLLRGEAAPRPREAAPRAPRIIDVDPDTGAATVEPAAAAAAAGRAPADVGVAGAGSAGAGFLGAGWAGGRLADGGLAGGGMAGGGLANGGLADAGLAQMARGLRERLGSLAPAGMAAGGPAGAAVPLPEGARFLSLNFGSEAGSRTYKLYIPAAHRDAAAPLLVMLHGCTQSPDDFAAGTRMNALAEEHGFLVAYPAQAASANAQRCWNWFSPGDQRRDGGEPALIAGITRQILRDHPVDPARVYVAGLSAGGAAAAIMGAAYPELYAAVGVHSGLPCGAARDMPSAFAAMRQGAGPGVEPRAGAAAARMVPAIVFHADRDTTVHPRNGDQVIAQAAAHPAADGLRVAVERGQVPGGHAFSRTRHLDAAGRAVLEQWLVHGGGHAWSGGSPAGSYTDPRGPDASREMLRFFLSHPMVPGAA